ncbi:hemocyte protein-glutamine gamma-glutamyltransferase-like isoform X2 [Oratosquilla oratoria]
MEGATGNPRNQPMAHNLRSRNRYGSDYNNWVNNLRSDYSRRFNDRVATEEEEANPSTVGVNKIERTHWYIKDNARTHNTIKFDLVHDKDPKPILRRGQPFYLAIRFRDRDYDSTKDRVILNFKFGPKPSVTKGTAVVLPIENEKFTRTKDDWDVRVDPGSRGKDLVLQVYAPAGALVGIWRLDIRCALKEERTRPALFKDDTDMYMLFNPWCKDDSVYLEDEKKRQEFIMNDKGKVYVGAYRRPRGRPWSFAQFEDVVLPVAMYVLEMTRIAHTERGNPIKVVRAISAAINSQDEDGILEGRWDGNYEDGIAPYKWTGSARILEEYLRSGYQPVKYGQCWVFSALTTTICRAMGIPCRSVTNFVSAHDTNASLTIDKYFDADGDEIEGGPDGESWDSIWNFHVWNDVWMTRPDLPQGYGGWQAIDATPQEESDSKMQCGPASLAAIRRGDIGLGYDAPFVFAEVNADIMHWGEDPESDWGYSRMKINRFHVGRNVLTKDPEKDDDLGDDDKQDVVTDYKNPEGSAGERLAIHNAVRGYRRAQRYYEFNKDIKEDVEFDLVDIDKIEVGNTFTVKVIIKNLSNEPRTVSANLTARSIYYTGVHYAVIKKGDGKFPIGPKMTKELPLTVTYNEYWQKLREHCMVKMYAICRVKETGQTWTDEDDFQVEKPRLKITALSPPKVKTDCEVEFSFKNPLNTPMTECSLNVDGPGLLRPTEVKVKGEVPVNGMFKYKYIFRPRIHGDRKIIATFNAKEIYDVNGSITIKVAKA